MQHQGNQNGATGLYSSEKGVLHWSGRGYTSYMSSTKPSRSPKSNLVMRFAIWSCLTLYCGAVDVLAYFDFVGAAPFSSWVRNNRYIGIRSCLYQKCCCTKVQKNRKRTKSIYVHHKNKWKYVVDIQKENRLSCLNTAWILIFIIQILVESRASLWRASVAFKIQYISQQSIVPLWVIVDPLSVAGIELLSAVFVAET